ncbi:MAG: FecCD family ABC transporter permease [Thermoplasmata archaeon]
MLIKNEKNREYFTISIIFLSILSIIFSMAVGPVNISISEIFEYLFLLRDKGTVGIILWDIRIPRIFLAFLVGSSLASVGVVMQSIFRNPLADPYITGTASGAAFGATLAVITNLYLISFLYLPFFAFLGAMFATTLSFFISYLSGNRRNENLLLAGLGISIFLSSLVSYMMYMDGKDLDYLFYWLMGSFSGAQMYMVYTVFLIFIPSIIILIIFSRDLDLFMIGEEHAKTLGMDVNKKRIMFYFISSLLTGVSISFVGIIGFVGLIIPHIIRIIGGSSNRFVLFNSIFLGGSFMVISDTIARSFNIIEELPVGIITSLIGIPFFLYLIAIERRYWT